MKKLSFKSVEWLEKFPVGIVILCIGLFYFIYLPVNYDFDGTVFSHYLRHGLVKGDLSAVHQPHHPLYIPVNYFLYKGLNTITGYNVLEYFHLQLFSLIFGMLTLWFSYKIIRQMTDSRKMTNLSFMFPPEVSGLSVPATRQLSVVTTWRSTC